MIIEYLTWFARLGVAVVFGLAAWGKASRIERTRAAVAGFGIPARLVGAVAVGLPLVEAVIALAILPPATAVWAAVGALGFLAVVTGLIIRLLSRGQRPTCACFGTGDEPINGLTVVRNGLFAAVTVVALIGSLRSPAGPAGLPMDHVAGSALFAGLIATQIRQHLAIRALARGADGPRLTGPPVGTIAPELSMSTTTGQFRSLADLLAGGRPVVLLFVHPGCLACRRVVSELPGWSTGERRVVVIGGGPEEETGLWFEWHDVRDGLHLRGRDLMKRYRLSALPSAVSLDAEGRVTAPTATGYEAIRDLLVGAPVAVSR